MKKGHSDRIVFAVIFLVFALLAIFISLKVINSRKLYKQDVQRLYQITTSLGYNSENHLNFNRSYAIGIDAYYDAVELLFTTDKSVEEFSASVDELKFQEDSSFSFDYGFLQNGRDDLKEDLFFYAKKTRDQKQPHVTYWRLDDPVSQKTITIHYSETNGEDIWEYKGKEFEGGIVEVNFNRHY